jgi:hypothetical protein
MSKTYLKSDHFNGGGSSTPPCSPSAPAWRPPAAYCSARWSASNHAMGQDWVLKAFIVVVVGGMGSLGGSIAASIFISLLEAYAAIWVSPAQAIAIA